MIVICEHDIRKCFVLFKNETFCLQLEEDMPAAGSDQNIEAKLQPHRRPSTSHSAFVYGGNESLTERGIHRGRLSCAGFTSQ